jgi:hypothetical protein
MLARYKIPYMQKLSADDPAAKGKRIDTRKHTKHFFRPEPQMVQTYLAAPSAAAWEHFKREYLALLQSRFEGDKELFDELYLEAMQSNVFLGCSCPTKKNPDVQRCHTVLALQFMSERYPDLQVVIPSS